MVCSSRDSENWKICSKNIKSRTLKLCSSLSLLFVFAHVCLPSLVRPSLLLRAFSLSSCFFAAPSFQLSAFPVPSFPSLFSNSCFTLPSLLLPSVAGFLLASQKRQKTSQELFQQSISFCCCCRRVVMHRPASCRQRGDDHGPPSTEPSKAALLSSPRRRPRRSSPEYKPRSEYKDAYRAYSPSTIRRIYQENRKAMQRNQKRNIEGSKTTKDLLPAVSTPRTVPPRPRKPQPHPEQKPKEKTLNKKENTVPCTCPSPVHSSSSSDVSCVSLTGSGRRRDASAGPSKPFFYHPCSNITWYIPGRRTGLSRVARTT